MGESSTKDNKRPRPLNEQGLPRTLCHACLSYLSYPLPLGALLGARISSGRDILPSSYLRYLLPLPPHALVEAPKNSSLPSVSCTVCPSTRTVALPPAAATSACSRW